MAARSNIVVVECLARGLQYNGVSLCERRATICIAPAQYCDIFAVCGMSICQTYIDRAVVVKMGVLGFVLGGFRWEMRLVVTQPEIQESNVGCVGFT